MKGFRAAKIAEQMQHELAEILSHEAADPRIRSVSVTAVEVSQDLRYAKILIAPPPDLPPRKPLPAEPMRSLKKATGYVRHCLAERLQLRRMPELRFEYDRGERSASRIDTLLERIKKRSGSSSMSLFLLLALSAFSAGGSQPSSHLERYEASASIMGTVFTVAAYGERRGQLASAVLAAFDEARRIDAFLSNYKPDSELSRINRQAAEAPVVLSSELAALLQKCLQYSRRTEGAFDITVGPLMRVWGFFRGSGEMPSPWSLARAREKVGYRYLDLDSAQGTIRFLRAGVELDPGGIGKGYAVDRMAAVLRQAGVQAALVSAGSSSLYAVGQPPNEPRGWYVRIRRPRQSELTAAELYLKDESLSTSGSYEKFFQAGGKVYSHIMDPRTGMPAQNVTSVSVVAPATLDSEAWTTAIFVNGLDWIRTHKPEGFRVFLCADDDSCGWVEAARNSAP